MVPRRKLCAYTPQNEGYTHKVRLAELTARQFGCVSWAQLRTVGVAEATIARWTAIGYLTPILPRVYSVGPIGGDQRSRLCSLLLFAGPRALLSHGTAAYWRGWLRYPVAVTHVSTPRQIRLKLPGVLIHCRRELDRELINGLPCTTTIQTLLDLAASEDEKLVSRSLAQLDFQRQLKPNAIREACGRGKPGSKALLKALNAYMPQLARTKSELEDDFLYLCQRFNVPLPRVNAKVHGEEPDCYWPEYRLVVELDGDGNHGTPAQRNRDRRKELTLRAHGLTVVRYAWDQVTHHATAVATDVLQQIERCSRRTA